MDYCKQNQSVGQAPGNSIGSLQVIRAIAAIIVMLYHVSDKINTRQGYSSIEPFFGFGISGVDIFFVLSGFIIYSTSMKKRSLTTQEFLINRFTRIFPIYWVALFSTIAVFLIGKYLFSISEDNVPLLKEILTADSKLIFDTVFLIPNETPLVGVSWTLSFEITFYLLFGILFFRQPRFFMFTMAIWVALCWIIIFYLPLLEYFSYPLRRLSNPIVTEFFFGCIVAICVSKYQSRCSFLILGAGIILFMTSAMTLIPSFNRVFLFGIPSAFIIYGAANIKANCNRFLIYLGDASYSLYLFHCLILQIIIEIITLFFKFNSPIMYLAEFGLISLLCIVISCFIHSFVEVPLLNYLRNKLQVLKINRLGEAISVSNLN